MARALARGMVQSGIIAATDIYLADPQPSQIETFTGEVPGATVCETNAEVASSASVVVLAVKPQVAAEALQPLRGELTERQLLVSVAAGRT